MDDATFEARLAEIRQRIEEVPAEQRPALEALLEETRERHADLRFNMNRLRNALDDYQLTVQYLIFDRDACRRERDELRRRMQGES